MEADREKACDQPDRDFSARALESGCCVIRRWIQNFQGYPDKLPGRDQAGNLADGMIVRCLYPCNLSPDMWIPEKKWRDGSCQWIFMIYSFCVDGRLFLSVSPNGPS
jgi:hypothetical protein